MCVAVVVDSKERVPRKYLKAMHEANGHGAGISWLDGTAVSYRKGLTWEEIDNLQMHLPRPFFMHFRIATHGARIPELTHPFPLGWQAFDADLFGQAPAVLMHNGTWNRFRTFIPEGVKPSDVSDTQIAAFVANWHEEILQEVSWSNAIMRATGKPKQVDITLRGRWSEFEGNQYSNDYWQRELAPKVYYSHQTSNYGNYGPYGNWNDYYKKYPEALNALKAESKVKHLPETRKKGDSKLEGAWADGEELFTKGALNKLTCKNCNDSLVTPYVTTKEGHFLCYECVNDRYYPEEPTANCPDCKKEISQVPCACAGMDANDFLVQCPNPKCCSYDVESYSPDSKNWWCNQCYACFEPDLLFQVEVSTEPGELETLTEAPGELETLTEAPGELETLTEAELDALDAADLDLHEAPLQLDFPPDLVITGDRPGDQSRINEIIARDSIKLDNMIVADDD